MASGEVTVHDLIAQTQFTNQASAQAAAQIKADVDAGTAAGQKAEQATADVGAAEAIITGVKEAAEARAKQAAAAITAAFGANPNEASQKFQQLGEQYAAKRTEQMAATADVRQRQSVGFLDDPVEWISNNLLGGTNNAINKANLSELEADTLQKTIKELNEDAQQIAVTANTLAETKNAATAQAAVDKVKAQTTVAAAAVTQQNMKFNIDGINAVQNINETQLRNSLQLFGAENAEKQLALQAQSVALHATSVNLEIKKFNEVMEQKKLTTEAENAFADTVNTGRAKLGLNPIPAKEIMLAKKLGGSQSKAFDEQFKYGDQIRATGSTVIDSNSAVAVVKLSNSNAPTLPAKQPVIEAIKNIVAPEWAKLTPAEKKADPYGAIAKTNGAVKEYVDILKNNINTTDPRANFYAAPDVGSIAEMAPVVKTTALYQKVLSPVVSSVGKMETDPNKIMQMSLAAVKAGTITFNEHVRGIETLFRAAGMVNNVTRGYTDLGIPNQDSYNTTLSTIDPNIPLSKPTKVNLWDPAAITYYSAGVISAQSSSVFGRLSTAAGMMDKSLLELQTMGKPSGVK